MFWDGLRFASPWRLALSAVYVLPCARSVGFASWLTIVREVAGRGCAGFGVQSQILIGFRDVFFFSA